ncbi:hypothetical protein POTOM_042663 [Populus tomentosa]|uniref:Glucosamine/galactosamine-6-phosphate isomerase domain-containing protein n=1 Tax=Populus tomentosa TaxID=118781 RepID=A0A8X7YKZ3_POPTO|nr:hypothetical protein POTOM_042663 [Populus tomentosa]
MDATNNKVVEVCLIRRRNCQCLLRNTQQVYRTSLPKKEGLSLSFCQVFLSSSLSVGSIDWSKWHVFWVDERLVPKDHPDSNDKLAFDGFLSMVPILPGNAYAINDALSAEGAADDCETCLKHLVHTGVIEKSPHLWCVVRGAGKADVVQSAVGNGKNSEMLPVQTVSPEGEFRYGRIEWKIMRERVKKEVMLVGANDLHVGRVQRAFISSEVLFFVSNDK